MHRSSDGDIVWAGEIGWGTVMTPRVVLRLVMTLLIVIVLSFFVVILTVNDPHDAWVNVPPTAKIIRLIAGNVIFWGLLLLMRAVYWLIPREEMYRMQRLRSVIDEQ